MNTVDLLRKNLEKPEFVDYFLNNFKSRNKTRKIPYMTPLEKPFGRHDNLLKYIGLKYERINPIDYGYAFTVNIIHEKESLWAKHLWLVYLDKPSEEWIRAELSKNYTEIETLKAQRI